MSNGERKLAAIMFTDIVGYTKLMQENESATVGILKDHRELIRPLFASHGGREVKTIGDAFLVEFSSALDATLCAIAVQSALNDRRLSRGEKLDVRIGIHVGDVIESKGDILGDAVNIASRIEPLAEPGGVCISGQVYAQVKNKIPYRVAKTELREMKNIREPVDVYTLLLPWEEHREIEPEALAFDKKRVAVLPFSNFSPDPNDEYFADGMTEELISTVSRIPELSVISRTSVMGYKKKDKKASEIAGELRVGSLIEGSVRKAGNRVRITVQLVDAASERHLWAESYDRNLEDIFAVQGEVAEKVSHSLAQGVFVQGQRKDTDNMEAYTMYLRAMQLLHDPTEPNVREALALVEGALSKDPRFVRAYAALATALWSSAGTGYEYDWVEANEKAEAAASKAIELGPEWAEGYAAMSVVRSHQDRFEEAVAEAAKAVSLNPNLSEAHISMGFTHTAMGRLEKATECYAKAYELDPLSWIAINNLAETLLCAGKLDQAWDLLKRLKELYPTDPGTWIELMFWYILKKDFAKAQEAFDVAARIVPGDIWVTIDQGVLYALTNRREDAMRELSRVLTNEKDSVRLMGELYIQNALGNYDEAFRALMRGADLHTWPSVNVDPFFAELRKDPRFAEFCKKVGIPP